ncbi:unnamed protein product [Kuraishia capsulata CBS 1993]|uniref:Aminotransferase class I/classII large domain-containing protein n=1 Tax=Kuraishia capsulata CBS 1993 TaxID=1382522 RepID=W6MQX5_9ASCO|nr:uncharacterized protein KUCA_T00003636001 [Kuraishia capsulata CBS 1993]CDK27657.1 unnamed protein product [Kuraishia capsulata CBS 1993]
MSVRSQIRRMSTKLPTHNPYFKLSGKDIWTLINETAAQAEADTGKKVVNLGQGFFSYSPPPFAIQAAKDALDNPMANQYSPSRGRPSLVQALSRTFSPFYGRTLTPDEIAVTTGANEGMFSCFVGFLEPEDEVIVFEPFFDQYIPNIELAGAKVVYAQIHPPKDFDTRTVDGDEWFIDFEELESKITAKTKMIVLNSPHNPIGKVFTREELLKIGELAIKHNLLIISDEVYENLYYKKHIRVATLSPEIGERTLTIGSAGKSFAATGWRIGWVIGSEKLVPYVTAAHTRICFSSPSVFQEAVGSAFDQALTNGYFEKTRQEYLHKYAIFTKVFEELGLPYTKAEGGYFLLVNFKKVNVPEDYEFPPDFQTRAKDFRLAYWLIREFGVVSIPPSEFYLEEHTHVVEDCLRFAVCKDDHLLEEAVERLRGLSKYIN